jgi:galactose oxidase-like protein
MSSQSTGAFTATGEMSKPRWYHTATLLRDGRLLIAGGFNNTAIEASAELYDPSGSFFSTGNMTVARESHTATLLADGRVLIAGGNNTAGSAALTAELYDPSTGSFAPTGIMTTRRAGHQAVLLADGRVLIAGGGNDASAELYDPYSGTFTRTGDMLDARVDTATLLANGTVLITHSGISSVGSTWVFDRHAEVYTPALGSFAATGDLVNYHSVPTSTLLPSGKVLIVGGDIGDGDGPSSSAELYNPDTGIFTATTGGLAAGREGHSATLLSDGTVLIAGGFGSVPVSGGGDDNLSSAEVYDPILDAFRPSGSMATGRESHRATLLSSGSFAPSC